MKTHLFAGADQAISGGTNLIAVIAIARHLSAEEFGQFSVVYAGLMLFLAGSRGYLGIPIALSAAASPADRDRVMSGAFTAAVALSPVYVSILGLLIPATALVTGSAPSVNVSVAVAAASAGVLVQDGLRYCAIARNRALVALVSDVVWLAGVTVLLLLGNAIATEGALVVWVGSIYASALVAVVALRPPLSFAAALQLLRPRSGARESATLEAALATGTTLVVGIMVATWFSASDTGSLRGAGTLLGPVNILIAALDLVVLGRVAGRARVTRVRMHSAIFAALLVALSCWAAILLTVPDSVGTAILNETWLGTREILPVTLIESAFIALGAVASLELKIQDAPYAMTIGRLAGSGLTIGGVALIAMSDAPFVMVPWVMVVASLLSAGICLGAAIQGIRDRT